MYVETSILILISDTLTSFMPQNHEMNWELKMATVEQVYGKAASMRLRTEKAVLEQFKVEIISIRIPGKQSQVVITQRLPGLPSSNAGIDTITGMDEQVDLEDILNGTNLCTLHAGSTLI